MTEQTFIDLGMPSVSEVRPGDIVTMKYSDPNAVPFESEAWVDEGGNTLAGLTFIRDHDGETCVGFRYVVSVKRPAPSLPTKPGAVVFPYNRNKHSAYALDGAGTLWNNLDSLLDEGPKETGKEAQEGLTKGTHYVAFEGVEVDG